MTGMIEVDTIKEDSIEVVQGEREEVTREGDQGVHNEQPVGEKMITRITEIEVSFNSITPGRLSERC